MRKLFIWIIRAYQIVFAGAPRSCRFEPTCSQYAVEAIERYGVLRGIVKAAWRVLRCNPWNPGGYDPVR
ncbi:membrane protein insertion efficiency factor YidD [candidate division WOR-3 bacterium]|nr:membrane protein insertion efficiency factor YidD [candidate division WOR-3 bacterium]